MSLLETACPHCGKSMVFSPIDYINTEERPEMIQKVRDGEAFVSICGHCGKKSHMETIPFCTISRRRCSWCTMQQIKKTMKRHGRCLPGRIENTALMKKNFGA